MHKNKKKGTTKETEKLSPNDLIGESDEMIRQMSQYTDNNTAAPLNDIFFENKSNPLSSKGN